MFKKWWVAGGDSLADKSLEANKETAGCGIRSAQLVLQARAGFACISLNEEGKVLEWDGSAEYLFGYTGEQMVGRDLFALVPSPEEGITLHGFLKTCLLGGKLSEVSTTGVKASGEMIFCRWCAVPATHESGLKGLAVMVKDVTDQMLAVKDLNRIHRHAKSVFDRAPLGIFQADAKARLVEVNPEFSWMLGYESPEQFMASVTEVSSVFEDSEKAESFLFQLYEGEQLSRFWCRLKRKDGKEIWASCYGQITRNTSGRRNGFYGFCIDISRTVRVEKELKRVNEALRLTSILDGLTRISNRRHFDECMELEWVRHAREKASLSLILCDIDYFKLFNDTYGHQAGDVCLVRIAETLVSCVSRSGDLVARYGGEEFVVILPGTDIAGAQHIAEAMRQAVDALRIPHKGSEIAENVTLSLGVASVFPRGRASSEGLIRMADRALYAAKGDGRNRCVTFDEGMGGACPGG